MANMASDALAPPVAKVPAGMILTCGFLGILQPCNRYIGDLNLFQVDSMLTDSEVEVYSGQLDVGCSTKVMPVLNL